ncbi:pentapeptide repeat protein [Saccharothrix saharensis]|uniref:Pentapeptide repeat protein n=1 Tax=Saccharothrix saharensis TaxID=571190 RepID=A0A543JLY6_9PSEU|nr:pentapeptide repeat-containing protein [Saccharothrix saharensis]TQM83841.1 pentapeptide repeat protein [Saccharothrix saharensis]
MRDVHPAWSRKRETAERSKRARRVARRVLLALALLALAVALAPPGVVLLRHVAEGLAAFLGAKTSRGRDLAALVVAASVVGVLLWLAARRFREPAASGGRRSAWTSMSVSERTSLITSVTAVVALIVTALSVRATLEQVELSARGQVNDRYDKALGQLASDKPEVRVGGVPALERVVADAPDEVGVVAGLIAAFIRSNAPRRDRPCASADDVRVAVSALSRLTIYHGAPGLDLRNSCLSGASWHMVYLAGADLSGADLGGARFSNAELRYARFVGANLDGAVFAESSLAHADLSGASLRGADLTGTDLIGAVLGGADVAQARLPANAPAP